MNIWSIRYILLRFGHFSCTCAEIAVGLYFCFHSESIPTFSVALILVTGLKFSRFDNISMTLTVFSMRICRSSNLWASGQISHTPIRGSDISATWEHLRLFIFQWISLKSAIFPFPVFGHIYCGSRVQRIYQVGLWMSYEFLTLRPWLWLMTFFIGHYRQMSRPTATAHAPTTWPMCKRKYWTHFWNPWPDLFIHFTTYVALRST